MPCDTRLKPKQTIQQRATEIRTVVERVARQLAQGRVTAKVGPQGAIAFLGISEEERDGVTDACMYRRLMATGSALAKQAIERAELLSGRKIDRMAIAQGHHGHTDGHGGITWHDHKG